MKWAKVRPLVRDWIAYNLNVATAPRRTSSIGTALVSMGNAHATAECDARTYRNFSGC